MNNAISIKNLCKNYKGVNVIDHISFSIKKGEVFALLGANGAGKTTTLECIEGLREITSGEIQVNGKLGVQLQSSTLMPTIKVKEAVTLFCKWNKQAVVSDAIEQLGLKELENKYYKDLSTGQKRRLHLVLTLIGEPDIIVLDEPTAGLDVQGRNALHSFLKELKKEGKTILLASHDMAEVEQLCDSIAILKKGEIAFLGSAQQLRETIGSKVHIHMKSTKELLTLSFTKCRYLGEELGYFVFETSNLSEGFLEILSLAKQKQIEITDIRTVTPSLEESFLQVIQEEQK